MKSVKEMDHWLYGKCNNDSDTKGICYLIDKEYFNESACIRKFYDHTDKVYIMMLMSLILNGQIYLMVIMILMKLFILLL